MGGFKSILLTFCSFPTNRATDAVPGGDPVGAVARVVHATTTLFRTVGEPIVPE
jgi:hypothetical protein